MKILPKTSHRSGMVRHKRFLALGIVLCCRLSVPGAFAQKTDPAPSPIQPPSASTPAAAPHDALSNDPRLDAKVSLVRRRTTVAEALEELAAQTHVPMEAGDTEIQFSPVALSVQEEPLRDVLRSLAALNGWQWKRTATSKNQSLLRLGDPED